MRTMNLTDENELRELAEQKEREWRQLQDLRAQTLESTIKHKETLLMEERAKFLKLKDDFKYNLQLLADRDEELDKYEIMMKDLRLEAAERASQVSDLKIQLADFEDKLVIERRLVDDARTNYQSRLREKQNEMEEYRLAKDAEVQKERDEIELVKRKLERQLKDLEAELDIQKRELSMGFDDAMKKREHDFQIKRDELSNQLLASELKTKLLQKDIEIMSKGQEETNDEFRQVAENHRELEKELKEKTWELKDVTAMKDARIRDLERDLEKSQLALSRLHEDYERKHENLDKHCRQQEQVSDALRQARDDSERQLQNQLHQLQEQLNTKEIEMRNMEWTQKDMLEDKDRIIQNIRDELQQTKMDWDKHVEDLSKNTVQKDVNLQKAMSDVETLKMEVENRKSDIEKYKRELTLAVEREGQLERAKAQLDLDWSRRFDDVERQQYGKVEDLVHKLTTSRDEALADLRHKEGELDHQQKLVKVLMRDRDQALATLKHHGFIVDPSLHVQTEEVVNLNHQREMENLLEQNAKLKSVIGLMRKEMENLGDKGLEDNKEPQREHVAVLLNRDSEYVKNLEREIQELRAQSRGQELQLRGPDDVTDAKVKEEIGNNALIRSHIQSLNDQIGALRREKVEYAAQIKKLQMKVDHLESMNMQISQQPIQKQVEIDQLQYDIGAQARRHQTEMTSLRHQVSQLELELAQTRKEADEYYKGTLERNLEATSLGNEVSALKIQLSSKQKNIAFGGQELLIQQLQDQISDLKQRHGESPRDPSGDTAELKQKLRQAAVFIQQLAREKQQLIEVGNRLRAELMKAGVKLPLAPAKPSVKIVAPTPSVQSTTTTTTTTDTPPAPVHGNYASPPVKQPAISKVIENKLGQLEKLQYNLTKQELLFAQKPPIHEPPEPDNPMNSQFTSTGSSLGTQRTSSPSHVVADHVVGHVGGHVDRSLGLSLSSVGGESLQDLWRMVDEGPSELTARLEATRLAEEALLAGRGPAQAAGYGLPEPAGWVVKGQQASAANKPQKSSVLSAKTAGRVNKVKQRSTKIRNYNQKD